MKAIKISEFYLNQVKSALAYPVAPYIHLTDDEIKNYAIWTAMYEYFLKFPIPVYEQYIAATTPITFPFPDDDTIGVLDVRVVDKPGNLGGSGGSSEFISLYRYNNLYPRYNNTRMPMRRYTSNFFSPNGLRHLVFQEQMFNDAVRNNLNTFKYIIDPYKKNVTVYSTINAKVDITWAKTSNDFDMIKPTRIIDVINLSKAYLRLHLASLGGMLTDNTVEKQINVDYLTSEAKEVIEKIKENWAMSPDAVTIRMT